MPNPILRLAISAGLVLIQSSGAPTSTTSDGFGDCPAFEHSHADAPRQCFADENDSPVDSDEAREKLALDGTKEPSDDEVQAAVGNVADISDKFKFYLDEKNNFIRLEWQMIDTVKSDLAVFAVEKDKANFIKESEQLTVDFGLLDAYDDMLRRSEII